METRLDALVCFHLVLNISVEPHKTYGTVASIEIVSRVTDPMMEDIRYVMNQYAFQVIINKKKWD